jgi:hypothetical protein
MESPLPELMPIAGSVLGALARQSTQAARCWVTGLLSPVIIVTDTPSAARLRTKSSHQTAPTDARQLWRIFM